MDSQHYRDRVLLTAAIAAFTALLVLLIWQVGEILLVVFAGALLATGWVGVARWASQRLPIGYTAAVLIEVALCLGFVALVTAVSGPGLADQARQLTEHIPEVIERLREGAWAERLRPFFPDADPELPTTLLARLGGAFSTALGALANALIILFIGVYGAIEPDVYQRAAITLVPPRRRERAAEVLSTCARVLRWWLVGRLVSMTAVGVLTAGALAVAGIPLALVLGLLAGVLSFVPYVGPLLSAVPALLVGLGQGVTSAFVVAAIFLGVQLVENNLITPLVERKAVSLPPAALLTAQLLSGVLFGLLGVLLATPLTVTATVIVRLLYVEDILGDAPD